MARNDKRIDQLTPSTIPLVGTDLFAIYNANGTRNDTLDSITQYMGENIVVTGITANDTYVTGGTLNVNSLELGRNQGLSDISVDLSPLISGPFTGNTSGDCITDLYVSNIHSCSPLNINPNNEGDVLVGSSGFTFDVVNTRFGIGKNPQYIFDMLGSGFRTYMSDTTDVKKLLISGGTDNLAEFSTVTDYPSLGGVGGLSVGTIGPNSVVAGIVPERGQQGDTYIYSSARANGLNLISANNPSGAEDYIRLYAGQDATSTSDIHIQGSGTTRGYVGLNNDNPQELLHTKDGDFLIETSKGKFYSDFGNVVGSVVLLSGLTNEVPRMGIQNNGSITMGIRGITDVSYPGYGKQGDSFIYSDTINNGINIISQSGAGTDDYIRLYVGQDATSTPDIHIQGSGTTRGYVGLNNDNPQELLDVSGNAIISGNFEIQGQSNNPMYHGGTGSTFTLDFDDSNIQTITLTGNTTINNPSNVKDGAVYTVIIKQGGTTGTINSWGSNFKFESGTAPTLTTNAYAVDIMTFISDDTGILYGLIAQDFQ